MTLKQLSSLHTIKAQANGSKISKPLTESGVTTLSVSQQETALAKMVAGDINSHRRTNMVEDGVASLVALETKISKDFELIRYKIPADSPLENLEQAMRRVQASMIPLPKEEIEQRLTVLAMIVTIPKDFDDEILALKRGILAEKLTQWPADIVIEAFDKVEKSCKFWPTLAEFAEHCEWKVRPRKLLIEELQKRIDYR
jgi:hypothetical protein